jgi:hypothetical protein
VAKQDQIDSLLELLYVAVALPSCKNVVMHDCVTTAVQYIKECLLHMLHSMQIDIEKTLAGKFNRKHFVLIFITLTLGHKEGNVHK